MQPAPEGAGQRPLRDPLEPKITPEMEAKGYCLLDPVQVRDNELVDSDMGDMPAFVCLKGTWYEVKGRKVMDLPAEDTAPER